ncbi:MAG: AAA family ATPase [Anaerolineales bacterium]|nr:AAA family ATPase [Anaerolineales bacterium]
MDKTDGKVITFYSYKGGTGRSMALANIAWILASNGKKVLVIDWDLEAPGLHRYFAPFLIDPELHSTTGFIDFLSEYVDASLTKPVEPKDDWYIPSQI